MTHEIRLLAFVSLAVALAALGLACDNSLDCETADDCFSGETCYQGSCVPDNAGNNGNNGGGDVGTDDTGNGGDGGSGGDASSDDGGSTDDTGNGGATVAEVSAGGLSTCARLGSGELRCWGRNLEGQLGNGETSNQEESPVTVEAMTDAVALASGHSNHCAFVEAGNVYCWGSNGSEQITPEDSIDKIATPTDLGVSPVESVGLADRAICVLVGGSGGLSCLGSDSDPVVYDMPNFSEEVESLAGGFHHACAVMASGEVQCWGRDREGQAAGGGIVDNIPSIAKVALGQNHSCALSDSGTVYCWGSNASGQLGVGSSQQPDDPVLVDGLEQIIDIDAGFSHTCALDSGGAVSCWGSDGEGFSQPQPTGIFGLNQGVEKISVGSSHACALRESGEIRCWGRNEEGQLGDGSSDSSSRPVTVEF